MIFKRISVWVIVVVSVAALLLQCGEKLTINVERVTLSETVVAVEKGDTIVLKVNVLPENATNKTVTWTSSDKNIATVSREGVVEGVSEGMTIIRAKAVGGKFAQAIITVTNTDKTVIPTKVTIIPAQDSLLVGSTATLMATVEPSDATDKRITWLSSDDQVVTVDANGVVRGISEGTATITASTMLGNKTTTATIIVRGNDQRVGINSVVVVPERGNIVEGSTLALTAIIEPADVTDKTVIWTSSDENIATISDEGTVTGVSEGIVTITATTTSGTLTATATITVLPPETVPPTSITLSPGQGTIEVQSTLTLTATIEPTDATDKRITWLSSDDQVVTVDTNGMVRGISEGRATITATTVLGNRTTTATITVFQPNTAVTPTGITLSPDQGTIEEQSTLTLTATIEPADATDTRITWRSSNDQIAMVDANGVIRGISEGTATITATTVSGGFIATASITVTPLFVEPTQIILSLRQGTIEVQSDFLLIATVLPENATDKRITWLSSDDQVVTVDANGMVRGISEGTATITATTVSGNRSATATITVFQPNTAVIPTGITLSPGRDTIEVQSTLPLTATVLPDDATNRTVRWVSAHPHVATVDINGVVTAVSEGTATITATTVSGNRMATATIRVIPISPKDITLNRNLGSVSVGDDIALVATVLPANAANKNVIWQSSNENVATVNANGVVRGLSQGTTMITATTVVGNRVASASITVNNIIPTQVTINAGSGEVRLDSTLTLTATVLPNNATDKTVVWLSTNANVATIDSNTGVLTPLREGTVIILATTLLGTRTATATITIRGIPVNRIVLSRNDITLVEGIFADIIATPLPLNATNRTVNWQSSDESVVTVSSTGRVTAVRSQLGTPVTVTATAGGESASAVIRVFPRVDPTSITLTPATEEIRAGGNEISLLATIEPPNAIGGIIWSSSDPTIATVTVGRVQGISEGIVTITATTEWGNRSATASIRVLPNNTPVLPRSVAINPVSANVMRGSNFTFTASVMPTHADDQSVTWSSSDPGVAPINPNTGSVLGLAEGTAIITATTSSGNRTTTSTITVTPPTAPILVNNIDVNLTQLTMNIGETIRVITTLSPPFADPVTVTYVSSNMNVVTVSDDGLVRGQGLGFAFITVNITPRANGSASPRIVFVNVVR